MTDPSALDRGPPSKIDSPPGGIVASSPNPVADLLLDPLLPSTPGLTLHIYEW